MIFTIFTSWAKPVATLGTVFPSPPSMIYSNKAYASTIEKVLFTSIDIASIKQQSFLGDFFHLSLMEVFCIFQRF